MDETWPAPTGASAAPMLLTADEFLEAELRRLAAAAGSALRVTTAVDDVVTGWGSAAAVLVGADRLAALAERHPPRRDGVHVVAPGPAATDVFRDALVVCAESVVELPAAAPSLARLLADADDEPGSSARAIGVIGGAGGAGASVLAAALAREGAARTTALLVDVDPYGAGADRLVGLEDRPGVRWGELSASGRLGGRALRDALPRDAGLSVLSFASQAGCAQAPPLAVAREVLSAARRGFGLVVLDLPRHPGEVADELMPRCDDLVVVSTLSLTALSAAARLRTRLPAVPAGLVVRGRGRGVDPETAAAVVGLPLLAAMGDQRGLDESIALGLGPARAGRGPLTRAVRSVLDHVGIGGPR